MGRSSKKRQSKEEQTTQQLSQKIFEENGGLPIKTRDNTATKMAEALVEFVKPYAKQYDTKQEYDLLLSVGSMAWNLGIHSEDRRRKTLMNFKIDLALTEDDKTRLFIMNLLTDLIARKMKHFKDGNRYITGFDWQGERLLVFSRVKPKEENEGQPN